mmetsp:Transcript_3854/g.5444  ORF Transcript_3854/g.5444 Transcript_3854/m.5444 type:complete len:87 (+) Transcript_3854:144-404(+)
MFVSSCFSGVWVGAKGFPVVQQIWPVKKAFVLFNNLGTVFSRFIKDWFRQGKMKQSPKVTCPGSHGISTIAVFYLKQAVVSSFQNA